MEAFNAWLSGDSGSSDDGAWPLVERATSELLVAPDWGANLEVVDFGNASDQHAQKVAKSLHRQLQSRSSKVVRFTIELVRACAKNGNAHMLTYLGGPAPGSVIQRVASLAQSSPGLQTLIGAGSKSAEWLQVEEQALALIQEVAVEFQQQQSRYPGFYQTYAQLVQQGVIFPLQNEPISATSVSSDRSMSEPPAHIREQQRAKGPRAITMDEIEKLEQDLRFLARKMDIAERVLELESVALDSDEALDILDFLLQCKPRLVDLVEASAMGLVHDNFLEDCLAANDRICDVVERLEGKKPRLKPKPKPAPKKKRTDSTGATFVPKLGAPPRARSGSTSSGSSHKKMPSTQAKPSHPLAGEPPQPPSSPSRLSPPPKLKLMSRQGEGDGDLNPFDFFAHQLDDSLTLVEKSKTANDQDEDIEDSETLLR